MLDSLAPKPPRPWQVIAEEASHEHDPVQLANLIAELNQALEEQGLSKSMGDDRQKKSA
jgi:hypothetical protein